ncbi:uncharacterized, partial [Tachysurus ichikawai]
VCPPSSIPAAPNDAFQCSLMTVGTQGTWGVSRLSPSSPSPPPRGPRADTDKAGHSRWYESTGD